MPMPFYSLIFPVNGFSHFQQSHILMKAINIVHLYTFRRSNSSPSYSSRFCKRLRHSVAKSVKKRTSMGEIDEKKPFESVQDAISLFGDKSNHKKTRSSSSDEMEKEEMESLKKQLAKLKLKLEEKDSAYKQAILDLEKNQKIAEELSTMLTGNELEKGIYIYEGRQDKGHIKELESRVNHLQEQLDASEKEAVKLRDENRAAIKRAELIETILSFERDDTEELIKKVANLNETIEQLKMAANEAAKEKDVLQEKLEKMNDLENQVLEKSELIYSLQDELRLANESALSKTVSHDQLKTELEFQEKKNIDQAGYISLLESELKQIKEEQTKLEINSTETEPRNENRKEIESLKKELDNARAKMGEMRNRTEQAISRAEAAEKAKSALDEQIMRRREQKKRRKAALAALKEASSSREISSFNYENAPKIYQPLGEVLNMKF